MNHFFVEKYDKKWRKLDLFLVFLQFLFFFRFLDKFLSLLRLAYCHASIWMLHWPKDVFIGFICFCNNEKFINFIQFFSASCFKELDLIIWPQVLLKFTRILLVSTSCFEKLK